MYNLKYLVDFLTRITETCSSVIDNCVSNISKKKVRVFGFSTKISDHDAQIINVKVNSWKQY